MSAVPQNKSLDVGTLLKQAWEIFVRDPVNWILLSLVGTLALGVGGFGGYHHAALKAIRGESVEVGDAFYVFQRPQWILPILGIILGIMFLALVTCGLAALPIAFLMLWWMGLLVMFDSTPMDALKQSKDLAMANVGATIMMFLVLFGLSMVAGFIPFVGALVATPLLVIFQMLSLQALFGQAPSPQQLDYAPNAPGFAPPSAAPQYAPPAAAPPMSAPPAAAPPMAAPPAAAPPAAAPPAAAPPAAAPPMAAPPAAAPPVAAPAVVQASSTASAPPAAAAPVETATQSTTNDPDEIVSGKTIAMSSVDFEQMLRDQQNKKSDS
jgi:hypothetical protein